MKKVSVLFLLTRALHLHGMDQNNQQLIVADNADQFLASIDNERNSEIRYFTGRYFPESVVFKFGAKTVTPEQANTIRQSLVQNFLLGNKENEQRALNLTPLVNTLLENGYIEYHSKELAEHPLIVPHIKAREQELKNAINKWNASLEKQKVKEEDMFVKEEFSYKKLLPGSAWIKYPAVIGLSVLFSDHIRYAFWGAVKQAPAIWAKYFSHATETAVK